MTMKPELNLEQLAKVINDHYKIIGAEIINESALVIKTSPKTLYSPHCNDYQNSQFIFWCLSRFEELEYIWRCGEIGTKEEKKYFLSLHNYVKDHDTIYYGSTVAETCAKALLEILESYT